MKINPDKILENAVKDKRRTLRSDRLDISFGEIINLYEDSALNIRISTFTVSLLAIP